MRTLKQSPLSLTFSLGFGFVVGCGTKAPAGDDGSSMTSGISGFATDQTSSAGNETLDGGGSQGTGASSTDDSGFSCGEATFVLDAVPPNVMLVLDKSGSMAQESWDADGDPDTPDETRWKSLHDVVTFIVGAFDTKVNFGAYLFPSAVATSSFTSEACLVSSTPEVSVTARNGAGVLAGMPAAGSTDEILGATPAATAIARARAHLMSLDPTVARFVILVTDGAANCGAQYDCSGPGCELFETYDEDLPTFVGDMFTENAIPTFVVGIDIVDAVTGELSNDGKPEANTFEKLNAVAQAGGRASPGDDKFFNATNEADLMAALEEIAGQVVSCTIALDPEPAHPDFVDVVVGGETLSRVDDCDTENGWRFANPQGPFQAIELCGTACTALAEQGVLDAEYGCPPAA